MISSTIVAHIEMCINELAIAGVYENTMLLIALLTLIVTILTYIKKGGGPRPPNNNSKRSDRNDTSDKT